MNASGKHGGGACAISFTFASISQGSRKPDHQLRVKMDQEVLI